MIQNYQYGSGSLLEKMADSIGKPFMSGIEIGMAVGGVNSLVLGVTKENTDYVILNAIGLGIAIALSSYNKKIVPAIAQTAGIPIGVYLGAFGGEHIRNQIQSHIHYITK